MAMITIDEVITPAIAKEYLKLNKANNRKMSIKVVEGYAQDMKSGRWELTHQGIAFNEKGELIDGQHRLSAIVMANVPVVMNVTRGVPASEAGFYVIDRERNRNVKQLIEMSDRVMPHVCADSDAVSIVIRFVRMTGAKINTNNPDRVVEYIIKHEESIKTILSCCGNSHKKGCRIPKTIAAVMLLALYRGERPMDLAAFAKTYTTFEIDVNASYNYKVALRLREEMRSNSYSKTNFYMIQNAIYQFIHGKSSQLKSIERYKVLPEDM